MAKQRHNQTDASSSRSTMIVLVVGGVLVAALVIWALMRSSESPATTASVPTATDLPAVSPPPDTTPLSPGTTEAPVAAATSAPAEDIEAEKAAEKRISAEDLREKFNAKSVTIIDVRDASSYASGHIPGALNIPLASIQSYLDMIPKDKEIVTYCT